MKNLYEEQAASLAADTSSLADMKNIKAYAAVLQFRILAVILGGALVTFAALAFVGISYSSFDSLSVDIWRVTGVGIYKQKLVILGIFVVGIILVLASVAMKYLAAKIIFGSTDVPSSLFGGKK